MEYITEYSDEIKNVCFVEWETLCDSAITDYSFNIHAVNGWDGQPNAVVRLDHTLYMAP